jgi:hypothetical protein
MSLVSTFVSRVLNITLFSFPVSSQKFGKVPEVRDENRVRLWKYTAQVNLAACLVFAILVYVQGKYHQTMAIPCTPHPPFQISD